MRLHRDSSANREPRPASTDSSAELLRGVSALAEIIISFEMILRSLASVSLRWHSKRKFLMNRNTHYCYFVKIFCSTPRMWAQIIDITSEALKRYLGLFQERCTTHATSSAVCRLPDRKLGHISTPRLNPSQDFHLVPINVVVSYGPSLVAGYWFPVAGSLCFTTRQSSVRA